MQHFYDGQIRRYITQIVRLMSHFTYKDSSGNLVQVPVMYGDITRQVGSILRDNSENKIPSAPRMGVYITGLEMDTTRLADSSYVSKLNIRERAYDSNNDEYLNEQGKNYTVERLMPTPYNLTVNVDMWSTNTDQKLQILEQILMLFNPSLEIQTTDNYVDWTSLSVVNLESISWSSRSIPVGTESEIDVGTLTFKTPIYISPPAKVKRLGVIRSIVTGIFDSVGELEDAILGGIAIRGEGPVSYKGDDDIYINPEGFVTPSQDVQAHKSPHYPYHSEEELTVFASTHSQAGLLVLNNTAQLITKGVVGQLNWKAYLADMPGVFTPGLTEIRIKRFGIDNEIAGTIAIDPTDDTTAIINWDFDTIPSDTIITGPLGDSAKVNYIIDPQRNNPIAFKNPGTRILLLNDIGDASNSDGPDGWKNNDNSDFVASINDIVEWDGSKWNIVFDASSATNEIYTTNLNTGVQYKYNTDTAEWVLSFEGEYPVGTWRLKY
jgi:hypothetical protein